MIFKELTKIVADNNLIERSKEMFWEVLKAYQEEDPEEFIENFDNYNKSNVTTFSLICKPNRHSCPLFQILQRIHLGAVDQNLKMQMGP